MQIILILAGLAVGAWAQTPYYSILQGSTSETATHLTVVARESENLTFDASGRSPESVERVTYPGGVWAVYRVRFNGLKPRSRYTFNVYSGGRLQDERYFRTGMDTTGRIAFGSCMLRQFHNPFMWSSLEKEKPDAVLLLGDSVYLDRKYLLSPRKPRSGIEIWMSFAYARNTLGLYFWKELKPVLAVWDDHDSGFDNDDSRYQLMPEVRKIFDTFFANDEIPGRINQGPGLSKSFDYRGRRFIMLDGRSFRRKNQDSPLFGSEQEEWLKSQIRPGLNVLMSGSQFFGRFLQEDSMEYVWPEYAAAFYAKLRQWGEERGARFIFGSGDVHFSEVQAIEREILGYPTVEITSSSIHSAGGPGFYWLKPSNPRRTHVTGTHNVVLLEFDPKNEMNLTVRSLGWRGNDLFRTEVSLPPRALNCEQFLDQEAVQEEAI